MPSTIRELAMLFFAIGVNKFFRTAIIVYGVSFMHQDKENRIVTASQMENVAITSAETMSESERLEFLVGFSALS